MPHTAPTLTRGNKDREAKDRNKNPPVSAGKRNEAEPAINWNSSFLVRCTWRIGVFVYKIEFRVKQLWSTIWPILATSPPDSFMPIMFGCDDNLGKGNDGIVLFCEIM